ncbi:hypothetical protein FLP10_14770 [Agromyces intestinalis]|uniref:Uncharacterized protein n=1 Tax=Agromyces intestinalis TaxID=2592652 RepID=A0A5C1YH60_9MICO|nr:hypothetical protein [Agromyces intestinalis]QEO15556.1 hypothetical protein FLP10_14770 [Agromyces intestinalis]
MPRGRIALGASVALVAMACALVGCSGGGDPGGDPGGSGDPAALDGITASVGQGRVDISGGRIFVLVENGRDDEVTVRSVEVRSPGFEPGMAKSTPTGFAPGRAIAIRLMPTDAVCTEPVAPVTVVLDVETAAGAGRGELPAEDAFGALQRVQDQACLAESVDSVAVITLPEHLRTSGSGAGTRAVIDVTVVPAGGGGSVHVTGVSGTTLLNAEDTPDWTLDVEIAGSDPPSMIELPVRPNRCDAHAVAEDKVGTILPFEVTTSDGRSGQLGIKAGDTLRADLYAYYAERCGLPAG